VTAVVPVLDNGTLYTALRFVLTPDPRTLTVVSEEAPNVPSLNLRAWSNK
jgi:hypothetical protein